MSWSPARAALAAAFASMTLATAARAETIAPRRVVVVHVNGTPDETSSLEAAVRELLARLELTMATGSAPASSVLETVTIDLTATGAKVVVKSASGSTVMDRLVRGESPAIQREQIAHAVRGAAEAELLVDADRVAGRAPPVVDEPLPPPPPPPPARVEPAPIVVETRPPVAEAPVAPPAATGSSFGLDVATFAGGGGFAGDTGVVARVGGAITVASRRGLRPQLAVAALYAFPFETGDATITSRTKLFSMRFLPGLTVLHRSWFGLETSAGGGFDVITVDPASSILPETALGDSTTRVNAILSGAVTGRVAVATDVSVTLTAMLDVDPSSRRYVFDFGAARTEIFSPWQLRPMLLAGISFAALGGGR
ncbi:MAG: hypothetical protein U0270_02590 [Labilithrix sp.]